MNKRGAKISARLTSRGCLHVIVDVTPHQIHELSPAQLNFNLHDINAGEMAQKGEDLLQRPLYGT